MRFSLQANFKQTETAEQYAQIYCQTSVEKLKNDLEGNIHKYTDTSQLITLDYFTCHAQTENLMSSACNLHIYNKKR
jgi:hypothetical protein